MFIMRVVKSIMDTLPTFAALTAGHVANKNKKCTLLLTIEFEALTYAASITVRDDFPLTQCMYVLWHGVLKSSDR